MSSVQLQSVSDSLIFKSAHVPTPRDRIIAAGRSHFFAHGIRNVSMDDLAAELGMSKKTLYAHFENKTALLHAVILSKFEQLESELDAVAAATPDDFARGLHDLLECTQRQLAEIQPPFVRDIRREAPQMFELIEKRRGVVFARCFTAILSAGRQAGQIRKDLPIKVAIEILLGATNAVMNPSKLPALGLIPKSGYAAIISVFLEGVLTPSGRRALDKQK